MAKHSKVFTHDMGSVIATLEVASNVLHKMNVTTQIEKALRKWIRFSSDGKQALVDSKQFKFDELIAHHKAPSLKPFLKQNSVSITSL